MVDNSERPTREIAIEAHDSVIPSPEQRAQYIWKVLRNHKTPEGNELTNWDLLCFCVECVGFLSAQFEWLRLVAKRLTVLVYHAHYNFQHLLEYGSGIAVGPPQSGNSREQTVRESEGDSDRDTPASDGDGRDSASP